MVIVAAGVMAVGATAVAAGVSDALAMGNGAAVIAAVTATGGGVGSSFVTPPSLSTGVDVGVVGGEFTDVAGSAVGVGGDVGVGVEAQAATRVAARMSTVIL